MANVLEPWVRDKFDAAHSLAKLPDTSYQTKLYQMRNDKNSDKITILVCKREYYGNYKHVAQLPFTASLLCVKESQPWDTVEDHQNII